MIDGKIKVAVIGGGANGEHDVSLASAASAAEAIEQGPWQVVRLTIARDGNWLDDQGRRVSLADAIAILQSCAVALPLLHGAHGEDGTLAGLLDIAGIAYAGSGVRAGAIAMDKWVTKLVAGAVGVRTAPGLLLTAATAERYNWSHPVVVKPVGAGSSLGVSLVSQPGELRAALDEALRYDTRVLVEDVVLGREIDVAVLGRCDGLRVTSPPLEIVSAGFFSYAAKYNGTSEFIVPARVSDREREGLEAAAVTVYDALGCRGIARIDFFLTQNGPLLNEVNTTPGFTEQSQAPKMFAAAGLPYPKLLDLMLREAIGL